MTRFTAVVNGAVLQVTVDSSQLPVTRSNQDALAFWVAIPLPFTGAGLANRLNDAELTAEPTGIEL